MTGPGEQGLGANEIRVLHAALLGGLVIYAGVAWVLASTGMVRIDWSPDAFVRSVLTGVVGLASFAGLRISRGAYQQQPSASRAEALSFFRARSVAGWALIEGVGLAGICVGLVTASGRLVLVLAALAVGGLVLARPRPELLRALLDRIPEDDG